MHLASQISDGLSVLNLIAELLRFASDASLPTPPGPAPAFLSVADFLAGHAPPDPLSMSPKLVSAWRLVVPPDDIPALLAPASEDLYPTLPVAAPAPATSATPPPGPL